MAHNRFDISRRKMLGALGTIGGAAALGGAGTMAFFSDTEEFANNSLTAGELDLKVDWTEHYADWSADEEEGIGTVQMQQNADETLTGFPSTAPESEQSVFVSNPSKFMENTAIEAFPDVVNTDDPEGIPPSAYDGRQVRVDDQICDFPADLDGVLSHPFRTGANADGGVTIGEGPNAQTTAAGDPLVNISDVKPGDFGEVTFSFHVCGNPAYVWLTGALRDAKENGLTEPEAADEDEQEGVVELLDEIRAALWYDTGADGVYGATTGQKDSGEGDNIFGTGETLLPVNGSLRSVLTMLEGGMLPLDAEPVSTGGAGGGTQNGSAGISGDGGSLADEVYVSTLDEPFKQYVTNPSGKASPKNLQCADYETVLGISLVGTEVLNPETAPIQVGNAYSGCTTVIVDAFDDSNGSITLSTTGPVQVVSVKGGNEGEQIYEFDSPVILNGVAFTTPTNQNISNVDVCCPANGGGGQGNGGGGQQNGGRQCFPNSTTAYVGFEWWLPVNHANEIQGDSVSFDLGFYTEQCRHNDGSGRRMGNDGSTGTQVTVTGVPGDDDTGTGSNGATIETVDVSFPGVGSVDSVDAVNWSGGGPSGTENVTIDGTTVELDYPDNSNTYDPSTELDLTVTVTTSPGTYDAEFVFEDDDDSAVDSTDSFTI